MESVAQNILLVSHSGFESGAEKSLEALASGLKSSDEYTPFIALPKRYKQFRQSIEKSGVEVLRYAAAPYEGCRWSHRILLIPLTFLFGTAQLLYWIRRKKISLIHANGIKSCLPALLAARLTGVPCIWHVRDFPKQDVLTRCLTKNSTHTITPSHFIKQQIVSRTSKSSSVKVIANPVNGILNERMEKTLIKERIGFPVESVVVLMVAQFAPWKRHDLFLEAAARYLATSDPSAPPVHFVVVGADLWGLNARYEKNLKARAAQPDLQGRVSFLGQRTDVAELMAASDVLVLPSDNEPFGRVIVEAWNAGLPVVVADHGGPAELVIHRETGLHFRSGDPQSLADTLRKLIDDSKSRRQLAERGRQESRQYSSEKHVEKVRELYHEVLACG